MKKLFALLLAVAANALATESVHTEYPSVMLVDGVYQMWYSGHGTDVRGENKAWRIHYATSEDGVTWRRHGVVLDRGTAGAWDAGGVAFPTVLRRGSEYVMWYAGLCDGHYSIGLATSRDGVTWQPHDANPVLRPEAAWEGAGLVDPQVLHDGTRYLMWYGGLGAVRGIGLATSPDGIVWTRSDANPVLRGAAGGWDETIYTHSVIRRGGSYWMWYASGLNGHGAPLGLATSRDGVQWVKSEANPLPIGPIGSGDAWNSFGDFFYGPAVLDAGAGQLQMWLNGIGGADAPGGAIAYATSPDGIRWVKGSPGPVLCPEN